MIGGEIQFQKTELRIPTLAGTDISLPMHPCTIRTNMHATSSRRLDKLPPSSTPCACAFASYTHIPDDADISQTQHKCSAKPPTAAIHPPAPYTPHKIPTPQTLQIPSSAPFQLPTNPHKLLRPAPEETSAPSPARTNKHSAWRARVFHRREDGVAASFGRSCVAERR